MPEKKPAALSAFKLPRQNAFYRQAGVSDALVGDVRGNKPTDPVAKMMQSTSYSTALNTSTGLGHLLDG